MGSASCKWGNGCACEGTAHGAWEKWKGMPKGSPQRDLKDALRPLVGSSNDPWLHVLYKCYADGLSVRQCFSRYTSGDRRLSADEL